MTEAPTQYLQPLVCSAHVSEWERKFCASLIAQTRTGQPLSIRQIATLKRLVKRFQAATMRDDGVVE